MSMTTLTFVENIHHIQRTTTGTENIAFSVDIIVVAVLDCSPIQASSLCKLNDLLNVGPYFEIKSNVVGLFNMCVNMMIIVVIHVSRSKSS